jgi:hypothetical protein
MNYVNTGCKAVGVAISQTYKGDQQFTNWLTYVALAIIVICILVQLNYLNRALDIYNTAVVTPIYYVLFTTCVVSLSSVLFFWASFLCAFGKFFSETSIFLKAFSKNIPPTIVIRTKDWPIARALIT